MEPPRGVDFVAQALWISEFRHHCIMVTRTLRLLALAHKKTRAYALRAARHTGDVFVVYILEYRQLSAGDFNGVGSRRSCAANSVARLAKGAPAAWHQPSAACCGRHACRAGRFAASQRRGVASTLLSRAFQRRTLPTANNSAISQATAAASAPAAPQFLRVLAGA